MMSSTPDAARETRLLLTPTAMKVTTGTAKRTTKAITRAAPADERIPGMLDSWFPR
jgi:hypothetical protein